MVDSEIPINPIHKDTVTCGKGRYREVGRS
jgi:hypothetical protein